MTTRQIESAQRPHIPQRVVVIGGGFGGIKAVQALANAPVEVTLIDRRNFHLFQPLLYQVATGALSPANIAAPLRSILKHQRNARVLMGDVVSIDVAGQAVLLAGGDSVPYDRVPYDSLIVAAGVRHAYFGHDEWEAAAPGLKTVEDAIELRRRIFTAFEEAERAEDPEEARRWLTFLVVGAGPTGVELAGALCELARHTLAGNFRRIDPATAEVHLVEGAGKVLPVYTDDLAGYANQALAKLGVQVHLRTLVTQLDGDAITLRTPEGERVLHARTILWAAGVRASGLAQVLAREAGAVLDNVGRVKVLPDLSIPGHPELTVIGDMAHFAAEGQPPLPGLAQVAMQQGEYAARLIAGRVAGKVPPAAPFTYRDLGTMATIGRAAAVADLRVVRSKGLIAWFIWLFVHLMSLVSYQNRALVFTQWAWTYITRNRTARLITGAAAVAALAEQAGPARPTGPSSVREGDGAQGKPGPGA